MNNKGQTLVLFILLLPIIFILFCVILDYSLLNIEKIKTQNIVKQLINDELENNTGIQKSEQKITYLLNKNIENVNIQKLDVTNNEITVTIYKDYKSILSLIKGNYQIKVSYKGYKINNKIIIKKEWKYGNKSS